MCVRHAFIRYPATDPDLVSSSAQRNNSAGAEIAVRTLQNLPPVPYNGAQQIWNAAVRVGFPAEQLVRPDSHSPLPQSFPHNNLISRCGSLTDWLAGWLAGWLTD